MTDFHISLQAGNPDQSHMRAYRVDATKDLFGYWIVEINLAASAGPDDR